MKPLIRNVTVGILCVAALLYAGDYLSLRFQIPNRPQFGTVRVQPFIAVPQKNGKVEFMADDPYEQACVRSIFPHFGDSPCWYVERHRSKRRDI